MTPYEQYSLLLLVVILIVMVVAAWFAYKVYLKARQVDKFAHNIDVLVNRVIGNMRASPFFNSLVQ